MLIFSALKNGVICLCFAHFFLRKPLKTSISNAHFLFTFPQNALLIHAFAFF